MFDNRASAKARFDQAAAIEQPLGERRVAQHVALLISRETPIPE
jgi:hypothetical protein